MLSVGWLKSFARRSVGVILAVIGALLCIRTFWYVAHSTGQLPFWDQWAIIEQIARGSIKTTSIDSYVFQHNGHRLATSMWLYFIDIYAFHGKNQFLVSVISCACAAMGALFSFVVCRRRASLFVFVVSFVLFSAVVLSLAHSENLTWGFQTQFVFVYLFAFSAIAAAASWRKERGWWTIAAVLAAQGLAVGSMANGMAVIPVVAFALLLRRCSLPQVGLYLLGSACTVALFFWGYNAYSFALEHASISDMALYAVTYLGGSLSKDPHRAATAGTVGLAIYTTLATLTIVRSLRRTPVVSGAAIALVGMGGYIVVSAAATAYGRSALFGAEGGVWTRYSYPSLLFYSSLLGLGLHFALGRTSDLVKGAALALVLAFAAFTTLRDSSDYYLQRRQIDLRTLERAVLSAGPTTPDLTKISYLPASDNQIVLDFLKANRLSVFSELPR